MKKKKRRIVEDSKKSGEIPKSECLDNASYSLLVVWSILKVDFRFCVADDSDGREEEDKFRKALHRHIGFGKSRSIHFTLKGGKKVSFLHPISIQSIQNSLQNICSYPR